MMAWLTYDSPKLTLLNVGLVLLTVVSFCSECPFIFDLKVKHGANQKFIDECKWGN